MKKSTVIKLIILLIVVMVIFWITLNFIKNSNVQKNAKLEYNYFVLFEDNKMGVIDRDGNTIIEPNYDTIKIPNPSKDVFMCLNGENDKKFLNKNSEEIFTVFEEVIPIDIVGIILDVPYEENVLIFKENNKYGLIDYAGNIVLNAKYDEISGLAYKPGELKVKLENKYGLINEQGKEILKVNYDFIEGDKYYSDENSNSGYVVGIKDEDGYKYGYIDNNKKEILEMKYSSIERVLEIELDEIYLLAYDNGKGAIVKNKKELTSYEYQEIEKVKNEDLFLVEKNKKFGVINFEGKNVTDIEYDELYIDGINIFAKKDGQDLMLDLNGNKLESIDYAKKYKTHDENYFIVINNEGLYGVENKENNKIIDNKYIYIEYAFDGYFIASDLDGKTGIIDMEDNKVIDFKYDIIERLQNSDMIQTVELSNNKLELYNNKLVKIFEGENTQINVRDKYIALTNDDETKCFDFKGNEIKEVTENALPEQIGDYIKVYYAYGQVYYTDKF